MRSNNERLGTELSNICLMIKNYFDKDEILRLITNALKSDDVYIGSIVTTSDDKYISIGAVHNGIEIAYFCGAIHYSIIIENKADICILKMYLEK